MSQENRNAINIYSVYDNELQRMHNLLVHYMSLPREETKYQMQQAMYGGQAGASGGAGGYSSPHRDLSTIYKRIFDMQELLMKIITEHDELIQEKVAEMALTGKSETK